jgi:hypothetical protein
MSCKRAWILRNMRIVLQSCRIHNLLWRLPSRNTVKIHKGLEKVKTPESVLMQISIHYWHLHHRQTLVKSRFPLGQTQTHIDIHTLHINRKEHIHHQMIFHGYRSDQKEVSITQIVTFTWHCLYTIYRFIWFQHNFQLHCTYIHKFAPDQETNLWLFWKR